VLVVFLMNMLKNEAHLSKDTFARDIERAPTRDGFGLGVVEAGKQDENVVVLCADLKESTRAEWFEKEFPGRFIEVGVAEQNMATVAAGMAAVGKIPFIASYAAFSPGRNYEQIRTTIALNRQTVKVCGMHAGVSVGPDGATHQMLEDIGMMRMMPGMVVLDPADREEARKAVLAAALHDGPVYLRFGRSGVPCFTTRQTPFEIGKGLTLWESEKPKVALYTTGAQAHAALLAARSLESDGIGAMVVHFATVKPLDRKAAVSAAKRAGMVFTVEEHQVAGGFGSAVAEVLAEEYPVPVVRLGIHDRFGQSGEPDELLTHYGIDAPSIVEAVRERLGRA